MMSDRVASGATGAPRVSICVPVYECERYIGVAIQSVLDQTYEDFEVVILDNGSRDCTLAEVARFSDSRIRVIENEQNLGVAGNFNRALTEARGPYVKILCADDYIYPDCIARQAQMLDADGDGLIALVTCARDVVDAHGTRLLTRSFGATGRFDGRDAIRKIVRSGTNPIGEPAAVMFRADRVSCTGTFDEPDGYAIDVGFWVRVLLTGDLYVLDETLCAFRVHDSSWSARVGTSQARQYRDWVAALRLRREFGVTRIDQALSGGMSVANGLGRQLFYLATRLRSRGPHASG